MKWPRVVEKQGTVKESRRLLLENEESCRQGSGALREAPAPY